MHSSEKTAYSADDSIAGVYCVVWKTLSV